MTGKLTEHVDYRTWSNGVRELYRSALNPDAWNAFLQFVRQQLNATNAILIFRRPSQYDAGLLWCDGALANIAAQPENVYAGQLHSLDSFINLPSGEPITLDDFFAKKTFKETEFYRLCLEPFNIEYILGVDIITDDFRASLRWTRGRENADFSTQDKNYCRELLPHIEQALQIFWRVHHLELEQQLYSGILQRLSLGTLFLGDDGEVVKINSVAQAWLTQGKGLVLRDGRLSFGSTRAGKEFREYLSQLKRGATTPHTLVIERTGIKPLLLVIRPLNASERLDGPHQPVAAIFIVDPETSSPAPTEVIAKLLGLTQAEAHLTVRLANGQTLEQACGALDIRLNTGRAHLRAIFSKVGVTQQSQLVSAVLKTLAPIADFGH